MKIIKKKCLRFGYLALLLLVLSCQNNQDEIINEVVAEDAVARSISGKKIVWFGDSIIEDVQGAQYIVDKVATLTETTIYNQGYGGCRMARHTQSGNGYMYDKMCMYNLVDYIDANSPEKWKEFKDNAYNLVVDSGDDNRPQAAKLASIDFSTIDVIIISFGTNDYSSENGVPIGLNSDMTGNTFKGAINKTISKLKNKYPQIQLIFTTPIYRSRYHAINDGHNSDSYVNPYGLKMENYNNAIKEICSLWNVKVIDMYNLSGINKSNANDLLADGLHPNENGCIFLSKKYKTLLESYID